ncbi:MAG TPA: nitroreductase family deazaflavin-dependent oxidoreductase [Candidatus Limnocylindrales bacterium]
MDDPVGEQLARWGTVALVETRGRLSGQPVRAAVGFVEEPDGSLLVAAGASAAAWALNLLDEPACRVTIGESTRACRAEELEGAERARAIADLILRYGTPAERLGGGPAFRLVPVGVLPVERDS